MAKADGESLIVERDAMAQGPLRTVGPRLTDIGTFRRATATTGRLSRVARVSACGTAWACASWRSSCVIRGASTSRLALTLAGDGQPHFTGIRPAVEPGTVRVCADPARAVDLLDARGRSAYVACLRELREEIEEAERCNDVGRTSEAQRKKRHLERELVCELRPGGPTRMHTERGRVRVTRAIKATIRRIVEAHPRLGDHLWVTIRTGRSCVYHPDPRVAISWEASSPPCPTGQTIGCGPY